MRFNVAQRGLVARSALGAAPSRGFAFRKGDLPVGAP
jgi:hypothetical protein